jgi:hypothetical protein
MNSGLREHYWRYIARTVSPSVLELANELGSTHS